MRHDDDARMVHVTDAPLAAARVGLLSRCCGAPVAK